MSVRKTVKIHTNEPEKSIISLLVKGDVRNFVRIEPELASLKGRAGETITAQVKIIPAATDDFTITETFVKNGTDISFGFEKVQDNSGSYYLLTVQNKRQTPGRYFDLITAQTDTIPARSIKIRIAGTITN